MILILEGHHPGSNTSLVLAHTGMDWVDQSMHMVVLLEHPMMLDGAVSAEPSFYR